SRTRLGLFRAPVANPQFAAALELGHGGVRPDARFSPAGRATRWIHAFRGGGTLVESLLRMRNHTRSLVLRSSFPLLTAGALALGAACTAGTDEPTASAVDGTNHAFVSTHLAVPRNTT